MMLSKKGLAWTEWWVGGCQVFVKLGAGAGGVATALLFANRDAPNRAPSLALGLAISVCGAEPRAMHKAGALDRLNDGGSGGREEPGGQQGFGDRSTATWAKKIRRLYQAAVPAGSATPSPPIGPALGAARREHLC